MTRQFGSLTTPGVRKPLTLGLLAAIGVGLALGLLGPSGLPMKPAQYVPLPVYEIDAWSGSHHASLLNLQLGQPGVPVAPTPVDVDGDLLPDITVSVNLVDVPGGIELPPNTKILAPVIRVDRIITAQALAKKSPPLRITANLHAVDVGGTSPPLTFKFGYDTTPAGSIPGTFSAVLRGLTAGFDPLNVEVDTRGLVRQLDPNLTHYQGPLTLLAGYELGGAQPETTNIKLAYSPFPSNVTVGMASLPDGGQRFTYAHGTQAAFEKGYIPEVDLTTILDRVAQGGAETTHLEGRIDRLPRSAKLDIGDGGDSSGSMVLDTKPDGRIPDVDVKLRQKSPDRLLNVRAEIDGVPNHIEAEWALPKEETDAGKARLRFEAPAGIGAVEAAVSDTDDTSILAPFVPTESQYVNFQEKSGPDAATSARLITGRIEGVSKVSFAQVERGFDASFISTIAKPLQLHTTVDGRTSNDDKSFIEASSLIKPLPSEIDVFVRTAGDDETAEPLSIIYDASTPVEVQAALEYHSEDAAFNAACGSTETTCAALKLLRVPAHIETTVAKTKVNGKDIVKVDVELPTEGAAPDIIADVTHGADADDDAARPLVAHLDALGVPASMHAVFERGKDATVEVAKFDTAKPISLLAFSVANFLPADRPANVPPSLPIVGNGASIVARGDNNGDVAFEAIGRLVDVGSFRYTNRGAFGLHTEVGGNTDLNVNLDALNIDNEGKRVDVVGHALVSKVPSVLDICLRADGKATDFDYDDDSSLAPCVVDQPFAPKVSFDKSPLSFAYRASSTIDHIAADVHVREHGSEPALDHVTNGSFRADNIPPSITAHVLQSRDRKTPLAVQFDTDIYEPPKNVFFSFEDLFGDLQCKDPRVPVKGAHAVCASASLPQLPGKLRIDLDPTLPVDNFSITTDRTIDINNFDYSSIERNATAAKADVLLFSATIDDIPQSITGTLRAPTLPEDAPDTAEAPLAVDFVATPPIKAIDAHVRTYLGPNPFSVDGPPDQRAGLPNVDATFDTLTLLQSGDAMRTDIHLADFSGVGYRTGVDDDGFKYPSHVANLRFGTGRNVRAYIDAEGASGDTGDATQRADRVIADVTVLNMPAGGLTACFRGAVPTDPPATVVGTTHCDTAAGDKAAFELAHAPGVAGPSVHAFFRSTSDSDAKVLSGRVDVASLPEKLQGVIGDGIDGNDEIDDDTTALIEAKPDSVGTIDAHIATFDINDEGYSDAARPFQRIGSGPGPFPVANHPGQQVAVAAANGRLDARVRLGAVNGQPGSQLKKVALTNQPCPMPAGRDNDYPEYRDNPTYPTTYTCAAIDVVPSGGADPLAISLVKDKADGQRIALHDAGITDIPNHIQLTLTDTSPLVPKSVDPDEPLRKRCGTVANHSTDNNACLPPLLRFDASGAPNAKLFGVLDAGTASAINGLAGVPSTLNPNDFTIDATPSATGWSDGTDMIGVRAKIAKAGTEPKPGVRAATLLPLPESLTVYPVQSWDKDVRVAAQGGNPAKVGKGRDLRFGYVARKAGGAPLDDFGRLGMLYVDEAGNQTLVTDVGDAHLKIPNPNGEYQDERKPGLIPGEMDITLNIRKNQLFKQTFINVVGRVNKATDLRVQMQNVPDPLPVYSLSNLPGPLNRPPAHGLHVDASILNLPGPVAGQADDGSPTFRLSAELLQSDELGPSETPPPPEACAGFGTEDGCTKTNVALVDIDAVFNFHPTFPVGDAAHYVRVVAQADGSTTGLHLQAFKSLNPPANAVPDGVVTVMAAMRMDPFNLYQDSQLGYVLRTTVELESSMMPVILLDRVSEFRMRGKGPNISVQKVSGPGEATVVPFMFLDRLNINVELDVWLTTIPLLGVRFLGANDSLINMEFDTCEDEDPGYTNKDYFAQSIGFGVPANTLGLFTDEHAPNGLVIPSGETATVLVVPDGTTDLRFAINVLGLPILPGGGAIMSALDGWQLCKEVPQEALINAAHPGDPFAFAGHAVANTPISTDVDPEPDPANRPPVSLEVPTGQTMTLECGYVKFDSIDIFGTLKSKPGCATKLIARDVTVQGGVASHGSIVGDGDLTIYADNFYLQSGADVTMRTGKFEAFASDRALIFGTINATGASTTPAKTPFGQDLIGWGGGGHGGDGGEDAFGNDGVEAFVQCTNPAGTALCGDLNPASHLTEGGSAGGGVTTFTAGPGRGGGDVVVAARNTTVTGTIKANGADATPGNAFDPPAGGGGGGGIVVAGDDLKLELSGGLHATLLANGGKGACGDHPAPNISDQLGGGGGGGGIIKIVAGTRTGAAPPVPVGGAGATKCPVSPGHVQLDGSPGAIGRVSAVNPGRSNIEQQENYWGRISGGTTSVSVTATVPPRGAANDYSMYLCAMKIDPDNGVDADPSQFAALFANNASPGDNARPCGYFANTTLPLLQVLRQNFNDSTGFVKKSFTVTMAEGEYLMWSTIGSSTVDGQLCPPTTPGPSSCTYEPVPPIADEALGIDLAAPVIADPVVIGGSRARTFPLPLGDPHTTWTGSRDITIQTSAMDQAELSELDLFDCAEMNPNTGETFLIGCFNDAAGAHPYRLQTGGDGTKIIRPFAVDRAGNVTTLDHTVIYDITPPGYQSTINVFPAPDGANGWYHTPPNFQLVGSIDGDNSDGSEGVGATVPAWKYRIDAGDERTCPDMNVCNVIGEIPGHGVHVVHYTPVDQVQNRYVDDEDPLTPSPMFASIPIKVDAVTPETALLTSPGAADGANNWFVTAPWVAVLGTDKTDGSGLVGPGAGIFVGVNGATPTPYTAPFKLGVGDSTVCWYSVDVAGNVEATRCESFHVDTANPSASLASNPLAPLPGNNGWFVVNPSVATGASDATSGVAAGSLVVSIDGGDVFTPTGPIAVAEGVHEVRARVMDNAGRLSPVVSSVFRVDLTAPTVSHRVLPPDPAQAGWYRRLPRVALVANDGDTSSGISRIEYSMGGGPFTVYSGPFEIPEGRTSVTYRAFDRSGHVSATNTFGLGVDVTSPVAVALDPTPNPWVRKLALLGLGPKKAKLNFSVFDARTGGGIVAENETRALKVVVIVHDALGNAVRRIDAGTIRVTPGVVKTSFVEWDGSDQSLLGFIGAGLYHYRVIVTDEAGNWTETPESKPLQLLL